MVEIDQVLAYFVDSNDLALSVLLLKTIAAPEQGGLGYQIAFFHSSVDFNGYDVDEQRKVIKVDIRGFWGGENSVAAVANNLRGRTAGKNRQNPCKHSGAIRLGYG